MTGKYYVGLDLGTNSVGWAVTDSNYHLVRAKGKDLWGARLFDEADSAAERRQQRVSRRRRQRETARIGVLREYFADAINAVDPGFFTRLDESKYFLEDRSDGNKQRNGIFNDVNYSDRDYFREYPTIFHLRKELIESKEPHDVRLVYLALLNMFKHRGHFLNQNLNSSDDIQGTTDAYKDFCSTAQLFSLAFPEKIGREELENCFKVGNGSRRAVLEQLAELLGISKKIQPAEYELLTMIAGMKGKLQTVFGKEVMPEPLSVSFRDANYEEEEEEAREAVGDEYYELIDAAKEVHDAALLADILNGEQYLSFARVHEYEQHKKDLTLLKRVLKRYRSITADGQKTISLYDQMFRTMGADNYSAYVGSVNSDGEHKRRNGGSGKSQEDFYKYVKKALAELPQNDPDVQIILNEINAGSFMPKQLTRANGVIPNQVHAREMKAILNNAAEYLPFLNDIDDSGLTTAERIVRLFTFQIPYYVGPLGQQYRDQEGYNVWAKRKEDGRIYPWNFKEKIDVPGAAEKFIQRMVRHCTYLRGETSLPKQSLLYEKFMVLNELNNLRIRGEKPSVEVKQQIYQDLFKKGRRVTQKQLLNYLYLQGLIDKKDPDLISGIDSDFKAALSSYGRFKEIMKDDIERDSCQKMAEQIIFWGTVFSGDRKILREKIYDHYGDRLSEEQIKRLSGLKFEGWGTLSRAFLEMGGKRETPEEEISVIAALWNTNENLMELLSSAHSYRDKLAEEAKTAEKPLSEWTAEDLSDFYLSAPVKRMVWQTLKILQELTKVLGNEPDRVFVEMPREEGEKGKRTVSRKKKLEDLYRANQQESAFWQEALNDIEGSSEVQFRSRKLYLYYLQQGRDMYTGQPIPLDQLFNDNLYDLDHIYPRHFIKDDSLDNNLVLVRKQDNSKKSDIFPISAEIQKKQYAFWHSLLDRGFITRTKFDRLTRTTPFTDEEKAAFISRQLVETRQGTKAVTQILTEALPSSRVVLSRAGLVSDFRHVYELPKCRMVNDCHHAHDAYLNIVVGNGYYVKFTSNPLNFIREAGRHGNDNAYKYNMDNIFLYDIGRGASIVWHGTKNSSESIETIKKVMNRATPLLTARTFMAHGGITGKATIYSAAVARSGKGYIPLKTTDEHLADVTKYGGVRDVTITAYALVKYTLGKKEIRSLESIPLYLNAADENDPKLLTFLVNAIRAENKKKNPENIAVLKFPVRQKSRVKIDGYYYRLGGKTAGNIYLYDAVALYLSYDEMKCAKKVEKAVSIGSAEEKDSNGRKVITSEKNIELYDTLADKLNASIYRNKRSNIGGKLIAYRNKYMQVDTLTQCKVLAEIFAWFNTSKQNIDLSPIGGSAHEGTLTMSKKISGYSEAILFDDSVTGIYTRAIDMLKL